MTEIYKLMSDHLTSLFIYNQTKQNMMHFCNHNSVFLYYFSNKGIYIYKLLILFQAELEDKIMKIVASAESKCLVLSQKV